MKKNNLPRGIRNNNPANILRTGQRWLGLSKVQTDKRFCQFDEMKFGIRAFFVLARTYRKKYGIKTVSSFIDRFSPSSENDVSAYVHFIYRTEKFTTLDTDYDYICLLYYIIRYENGLQDSDMLDLGFSFLELNYIRVKFNIKIV